MYHCWSCKNYTLNLRIKPCILHHSICLLVHCTLHNHLLYYMHKYLFSNAAYWIENTSTLSTCHNQYYRHYHHHHLNCCHDQFLLPILCFLVIFEILWHCFKAWGWPFSSNALLNATQCPWASVSTNTPSQSSNDTPLSPMSLACNAGWDGVTLTRSLLVFL